jgi:DNA invertase Pin-like site-specific DNA recombinase
MAISYPYMRESHTSSKIRGISKDTQMDIAKRYWEMHLKPRGIPLAGPVYDPATSARHVPFLCRKKGKLLDEMLQAGDHVIFAYHDRGYRTVLDFGRLYERWQGRGITMHFANLNVDLSTAEGMLMANIMFSTAQADSDLKSQRNKDVAAWLRKNNRPTNGARRLGFILHCEGGQRQWAPYPEERALMRIIVRLRDEEGCSWNAIVSRLELLLGALREKDPKCEAYQANWDRERIRRAHAAYCEILRTEGQDSANPTSDAQKPLSASAGQ